MDFLDGVDILAYNKCVINYLVVLFILTDTHIGWRGENERRRERENEKDEGDEVI